MKKAVFFLSVLFLSLGCEKAPTIEVIKVSNSNELFEAIKNVKPGDQIVLANGVWKDVAIKLNAKALIFLESRYLFFKFFIDIFKKPS